MQIPFFKQPEVFIRLSKHCEWSEVVCAAHGMCNTVCITWHDTNQRWSRHANQHRCKRCTVKGSLSYRSGSTRNAKAPSINRQWRLLVYFGSFVAFALEKLHIHLFTVELDNRNNHYYCTTNEWWEVLSAVGIGHVVTLANLFAVELIFPFRLDANRKFSWKRNDCRWERQIDVICEIIIKTLIKQSDNKSRILGASLYCLSKMDCFTVCSSQQ